MNGETAPGSHNLLWNLKDAGNRPFPPAYVARFTGGGTTTATRFMVVR
ncbi:MAG: hypothetical protein M0C28_15650 [Candidatus Moduliflexus flocculans]|nr:hypothetical protein [Candidatus Moduliflexus flocculans]